MTSFLRRIPLARLFALAAVTIVVGAGSTAIALAVSAGPTPPAKPLADAIHDALAAPPPSGLSAHVQLVDHLFEGSEVESAAEGAGQGSGDPLLSGASGRLWIGSEGQIRLELQSERGATQILYANGTITLYDAARNTLYKYTPPAAESSQAARQGAQPAQEGAQPAQEGQGQAAGEGEGQGSGESTGQGSGEGASTRGTPTVAQIERELSRLMGHLDISEAAPTDVAGQPAYATSLAPKSNSGLFGDAVLAWDAHNGVPLRFALYAKGNAVPAVELAMTEVSFGEVPSSTFSLALPSGVKETTIQPAHHGEAPQGAGAQGAGQGEGQANVETTGLAAVQAAVPFTLQAPATLAGMPRHEVRLVEVDGHDAAFVGYGEGLGGIAVIESAVHGGSKGEGEASSSSSSLQLPTKTIDGAKATVLPTELGAALTFTSAGVQHILFGSVTASTIEAAARGL